MNFQRLAILCLALIGFVHTNPANGNCPEPNISANPPEFFDVAPSLGFGRNPPAVPFCLLENDLSGQPVCAPRELDNYFTKVDTYVRKLQDHATEVAQFKNHAIEFANLARAFADEATRYNEESVKYLDCLEKRAKTQHE